ncbi:hypothetical protein BaRGS_00000439, partial [Batillaria attramentaria]
MLRSSTETRAEQTKKGSGMFRKFFFVDRFFTSLPADSQPSVSWSAELHYLKS